MCRHSTLAAVAAQTHETFENTQNAEGDAEREMVIDLANELEGQDPKRASRIKHPDALTRLTSREVKAAIDLRPEIEIREEMHGRDPERRQPRQPAD